MLFMMARCLRSAAFILRYHSESIVPISRFSSLPATNLHRLDDISSDGLCALLLLLLRNAAAFVDHPHLKDVLQLTF